MARPLWQGAQKLLWVNPVASTVILLANSYSMAASRAGVSNFSIARDEAGRILNELKLGSDAQIVLMGEGGSQLLDEPTYDLDRLTQALQKTTDADYGSAAEGSRVRWITRRACCTATCTNRTRQSHCDDRISNASASRPWKTPNSAR